MYTEIELPRAAWTLTGAGAKKCLKNPPLRVQTGQDFKPTLKGAKL